MSVALSFFSADITAETEEVPSQKWWKFAAV